MSLSQPLLEPGTDVSRFRVEQLLARGGMGLVYRARDVRLDRPVALKVLAPEVSDDEEFRQRFVRECRLAAALDHPHVVPVYEADDWHGLLYVAMRFVHGADLASVLRGGPLDLPEAMLLITQTASALDAAHDAGLVHRDVKPGNLLVAGARPGHVPEGAHLYLTDFGLTKQAGSLSGLTRSGTFLGSLHYVAPEQIRGEDVDRRADLYALACVAFELLTGAPPFRRDQEAALLWAHMSVPPPRLTDVRRDLPTPMADVLVKGMAKDPGDRQASCGAFAAQLRSASGPVRADDDARGQRIPAPPTVVRRPEPGGPPAAVLHPGPDGSSPSAAGSVQRRRRWWLLGIAAAVAAAVAAGVLAWSPWGGPDGVELERQSLVVAPYEAEIPADWRFLRGDDDLGEFAYFGPPDRFAFDPADPAGRAEAAEVAADEPGRLVTMYVERDPGLANERPEDLPGQIVAGQPEGSTLELTGTTLVAGLEVPILEGGLFLTDDQQLDVYGVLVDGDTLVLFIAPFSVESDWQGVWDDVLASMTPTG